MVWTKIYSTPEVPGTLQQIMGLAIKITYILQTENYTLKCAECNSFYRRRSYLEHLPSFKLNKSN